MFRRTSVKSFEESTLPSTLSTFLDSRPWIAVVRSEISWAILLSNKVSALERSVTSLSIFTWRAVSPAKRTLASSEISLDKPFTSSLWFAIAVSKLACIAFSLAVARSFSVLIATVLASTFVLSSSTFSLDSFFRELIFSSNKVSAPLLSSISPLILLVRIVNCPPTSTVKVWILPSIAVSNAVSADLRSPISLSRFTWRIWSAALRSAVSVPKAILVVSIRELRLLSPLVRSTISSLTMSLTSL